MSQDVQKHRKAMLLFFSSSIMGIQPTLYQDVGLALISSFMLNKLSEKKQIVTKMY